ncbi:MAG TPA: hypothetical protein VF147_07555 [Vicinamibacterales bacterium]
MRALSRVLAIFLMAWEPMRVAAEFQSSYGTIGMRGWPAGVELVAHAAIAAFCAAAGWAVWTRSPAGPALAPYAVAASAAATVQSLYASSLPHQTVPGEQLPFAVIAVANAVAWIAWLRRARRVQAI